MRNNHKNSFNDEQKLKTGKCTDKIFILSFDDYKNPKYGFSSSEEDSESRVAYMFWHYQFGSWKNEKRISSYWTRDILSNTAFDPVPSPAYISKTGALINNENIWNFYVDTRGIQPALRIPISSKNYSYTIPGNEFNYTSTTSPYADNYRMLVSGNAINGESFKNLANYIYKDNSAVIPGIEQTYMGDMSVYKSLCMKMVPQGVCTAGDYMLISAYCDNSLHDHNSVIYVLNKKTRKYITTLILQEENNEEEKAKHKSHVGSLHYYDKTKTIYIADSSDDCLWKLPLQSIIDVAPLDEGVQKNEANYIVLNKKINLQTNPSCFTIYNDKIYVCDINGESGKEEYKQYGERKSFVNVYKMNGEVADPEADGQPKDILIGDDVQGIAISDINGTRYLFVSSSYGRNNTSSLKVIECNSDLDVSGDIVRTITMPNMSEDIYIDADELFVAFESASNYYTDLGDKTTDPAKIRPIDRIVSLDYKKIVDSNDYPVIVVPGVMGSNLYQNGEKIWSPSLSELLVLKNADRLKISNDLSVKNYDANGNPIRQNNQGKREYGANGSYKELVDGLCNSTGKPVYFFSYDWRQSNADSANKLYEFIEKVKTQENVGKVDIVAHSMGGIVTSYYASHKFNDGTKETAGDEQINKVITCSTPYEGSPLLLEKALGTTVLRNVNSDYKGYLINSAVDACLYYLEGIKKDVKTKFPSMTQLAPSERLYNQTPWFRQSNVLRNINYAATTENMIKKGTEIMGTALDLTGNPISGSAVENAGSYVYDNINKQYSYSYAKNQLEGYDYNSMTYGEYASLCAEDRHFGILYGQSRNFLSQIGKDGYNYLRSMDNAYFIVGVNNYTPVSGAFSKDGNTVQKLIYESKGDGTVPYASQTMMNGLENLKDSAGKKRLYTFTTDHGGTSGHTEISYDKAGAKKALDCVIALINDSGEPAADTATGKKHVGITIQCPVDVKIEKDGETLNSSDSDFSGMASFGRLDLIGQDGDVKSLCIDDELYNVQLTGTGSGTMDMDLEWYDENDELHVIKQFIDIPLTENTRLHFETNKDGITTLYADIDGDGTDDQKWYADNGEVGYQLTSEISGENQEEQKQEEQKQEAQPAATERRASASTAQPASVVKTAPAATSATTASKTGDTNLTALWITLSAVSAGIVTAMVVAIKKRRTE